MLVPALVVAALVVVALASSDKRRPAPFLAAVRKAAA